MDIQALGMLKKKEIPGRGAARDFQGSINN